MKRFFLGTLIVALLAGVPVFASAAGLGLEPVRVTLTPGQTAGKLTLSNGDETSIIFQIELKAWKQVNGVDQLVATDELLVVPPIFTLPPFGKQFIRIGARSPIAATAPEMAFRLFITEVPSKVSSVGGATVNVARRYSCPIFVRGNPDAKAKPTWTLKRLSATKMRLTVQNAGESFLRLKKIQVAAEAKAGTPVFEETGLSYTLAGQSHVWNFDTKPTSPSDVFMVEATTDEGQYKAKVTPEK